MANSKRLTLLNYLRDTLFPGITVAGGYNYTFGLCERGVRPVDSLTGEQFPATFIGAPEETRQNMDGRVNFQSRIQVPIHIVVKDADGVPGKLQEAIDNAVEDATKRLYVDITQGGRCHTTEIQSIQPAISDLEHIGGVTVLVEFMYAAATATP